MTLKNCKSCGKEIYFLLTSKGNRIPVNSESLTDVEIEQLESGKQLQFIYKQHVSHFSDCPKSKEHRKNK